jgi:hypothetical protein
LCGETRNSKSESSRSSNSNEPGFPTKSTRANSTCPRRPSAPGSTGAAQPSKSDTIADSKAQHADRLLCVLFSLSFMIHPPVNASPPDMTHTPMATSDPDGSRRAAG